MLIRDNYSLGQVYLFELFNNSLNLGKVVMEGHQDLLL